MRNVRYCVGFSDADNEEPSAVQNALNRTQIDTRPLGEHPAGPVGCFARWRRIERQMTLDRLISIVSTYSAGTACGVRAAAAGILDAPHTRLP